MKYVGEAVKRTISEADWRTLAIDLKDKTVGHTWSADNDYLIESRQFSDAQRDYLLIDDHGSGRPSFLEVDYDDGGELVEVTATPATPTTP